MIELKPCPFCGGKANLDTEGHRTWVICLSCGSTGKRFINGREAARKAAEAWNRRDGIMDARDLDMLGMNLAEVGTEMPSTGEIVTINSELPKMYGWVCPVCGRGLSPFTRVCPCQDRWEVTCYG